MMSSQQIATALRVLSIDAVAKAKSGHPGMPLGMADIASVLWLHFLKFNPKNPHWANRDRFILSNGHGSMLHYALLHLFGYALSLDDLKNFRQLNSKTPGHPERSHTPGIEVTTGPLAQGLACGVGMAIAEQNLATTFNHPHLPALVDHFTYVFVGDGCLMEGLSHEVCSLAGQLELKKLIVFYDCNGITIDGATPVNMKQETIQRFSAYQWHVIEIDGHDHQAIQQAIMTCQQQSRPSLIICRTVIGLGSKYAGQAKVHGSPLDAEDIAAIKQQLAWQAPPFSIPAEIYALIDSHKGIEAENAWIKIAMDYYEQDPEQYHEFMRRMNGDLPETWSDIKQEILHKACAVEANLASRQLSQQCLETLVPQLKELIGGSADLTPSNNTQVKSSNTLDSHTAGNYIHYGVREFGMMAIMNGIAAHQGFIPYGGTFLVFADYARSAIRMSAMMKLKTIFVLTHDSIALGEDGPTHQPIEHLAMLRATPDLLVWRPASALEVAVAWTFAIEHQGSSCLALSRQNLPYMRQTLSQANDIVKGGYIAFQNSETPELILLATGSELSLALEAASILAESQRCIRVVSMPCCELFLAQPKTYQESILPSNVRARIAIEAAASHYWYQFVGLDGEVLGIDEFGRSAPELEVKQALGIHLDELMARCQKLIRRFGDQ